MGKKWTVYALISPEGKAYIGQTSRNVFLRWNRGHGYKKNKDLNSDILNFRFENFKKIILKENILSPEEAYKAEKGFIEVYSKLGPIYNMTKGDLNLGIQRRKSKKRVYQIDDNFTIVNEFESISSAKNYILENIGGSVSDTYSLDACLNDKIRKVAGFYWCYKKKYTENWRPKAETKETPIVRINPENLNDIKVYNSLADALIDNNSTKDSISGCLRGHSITSNGYYWCYKEKYSQDWKPKETTVKKVICIETQVVYKNTRFLSSLIDHWFPTNKIKDGLTINNYHFCYLNDLDCQERYKHFIGKQPISKRIRCVETGQEFDYVYDAKNKANINIYKYKGKLYSNDSSHKKIYWEHIYDDNEWNDMLGHKRYEKDESVVTLTDLSNIEPENVKRNKKMMYKKPVVCVETGIVYPHAAEASRQTGIKSINMCLLKYRRTCGGFIWKYAEDSDKLPEKVV